MLPLALPEHEPTPPEGRRAAHKARTRAAILDAALELFAEQGFDETSVAEVAAVAGVSPATVARYFPVKEALLFGEAELRTAALREAIAARPRREAPYTAIVRALAEQPTVEGASRARLLASRRAIARSSALRGRAVAHLDAWRDAVAEGAADRGADPGDARTLAAVVVAVLDDVSDRWAATGGRTDLGREVLQAFAALDRTRRSP